MKQPARGALLLGGLVLLHAPAGGRAGVLLGVEWVRRGKGWEPAPQRLRTYWVTGDASGARVERTIAGLVLPQSTGIKRLSIKRTCTTDREDPNRPFDRCQDEYVAAALNAKLPTSAPAAYGLAGPCIYSVSWVDFVSPLAVAIRTWHGNNEDCEPRGFHWSEYAWVQRVDAKAEAITDPGAATGHIRLSSLAGASAATAYASAIEQALAETRKEEDPPCVGDLDADDQWTLFREGGHWRARTLQADSPPCYLANDITVTLPSQLIGADHLAIPWASLVKAVPDIVDAVSSPDGGWTLVITRSQLLFISGDDLSRQTAVSSLPDREYESAPVRLIMAEWAIGDRNVARWSAMLASTR